MWQIKVDLDPPNTCPNDCSGNGDCRDGVCECHDNFLPFDCSQQGTASRQLAPGIKIAWLASEGLV